MYRTDVVKRRATYWLKTALVNGKQKDSAEINGLFLFEYIRDSDTILKYRNALAAEDNWPETAEIINAHRR